MPVDGFGTRIAMLLLKLPPRFIPQSTARTATVDTPVEMLRNHDGELVDVLDALSSKPIREVSCLRKDVVADVAARRQLRGSGLGIKMAVETEGEDGCRVLRPLQPYSPPAPGRGRRCWHGRECTSPSEGQEHLSRKGLAATEETAFIGLFATHGEECPLVFAPFLERAYDLWRCLAAHTLEGARRRAGGQDCSQQPRPEAPRN